MIDANDPDVAIKIIWNNVFRPITSDDYDLRFYDCDSAYQKKGAQTGQIEYFQIGHYAGYDLVGRTEVEPLPTDPDFKTTGRYWLFGLYPILAPQEIRGTGFIRWRYADPRRGDDIWSLDAGSRRLRRVNEAIMSSSTASGTSAHAWDPDHYSGFNPKTEQYNYKFLGEKNMLATDPRGAFARAAMPDRRRRQRMPRGVGDAAYVHRRRRCLIAARINALDSRTVIYHGQRNVVRALHRYLRSRRQALPRHIYWLATRDRPVPDAKVAIYPFKRSFVVGAVSTDVQSGLGDDVLSAGHRNARARMLVHQYGRGGSQLLHHRGDGPRCVVLGDSHRGQRTAINGQFSDRRGAPRGTARYEAVEKMIIARASPT